MSSDNSKQHSNDEIRLAILCEFYNALHSEKSYGDIGNIPELEGHSTNIINANLIYLIDKGLIRGDISYTSSGAIPFTNRITANGIDIVEEIVKQSENSLEDDISEKLKKVSATSEKVLKFTELCVRTASMCQTAVNVAHDILSGLGA